MAALLPLRRCRWAWPAGFRIRWRKNCADSMHKSWVVCGYLYQIPSKSLFEAAAISDGTGGTQPNQTGQAIRIQSHTKKSLQRELLHKVFTRRSLYTEGFLHTGAFAHRRFHTAKPLHREFLHTEAFTHKSFYTEVFAQRHLYTK